MNNELINTAKKEFDSAYTFLKHEYNTLQMGRANTSLVEGLMINAYGNSTPVKNISTISIADSRTIQIQPWDRGLISEIESSIRKSELGLTPVSDGIVVRLMIPELTQDRRLALKKIIGEKAEEAKITMRNSRHKVHNEFRKMKDNSEMTEDDFFALDKTLQASLIEYTSKVDVLMKEKESDIMNI